MDPAAADTRLLWLSDLYDLCAGRAYGMAIAMVGDTTEAEGILEASFLSIARIGPSTGTLDEATATVLETVRRNAIRLIRGRPQSPAGSERTLVARVRAADRWPRGSTGGPVSQTLAGLPPAQRSALHLAYFGGLTVGAIAERLELSAQEVGALLNAALRAVGAARANTRVPVQPDRSAPVQPATHTSAIPIEGFHTSRLRLTVEGGADRGSRLAAPSSSPPLAIVHSPSGA